MRYTYAPVERRYTASVAAIPEITGKRETQNNYAARERRPQPENAKAGNRGGRFKRRASVCGLIIAFILIAKVFYPDIFSGLKEYIREYTQGDVDYKTAMEYVGKAVSGEEDFSDAIQNAYVAAFRISDASEKGDAVSDAKEAEAASTETPKEDTEVIASAPKAEENTVPLQNRAPSDASGYDAQYDAAVVSAYKEAQSAYSDYELPQNVSYEMPEIDFDHICPVMGTVSSTFGYRSHPADGVIRFHYGTDIAADEGTDVIAFADGVVISVGESTGYGNYVLIEHEGGVKTQYSHCREIYSESGDTVTKGDVIAAVGQTGNATGPCLHFEVICDGTYVNPEYYVSWS